MIEVGICGLNWDQFAAALGLTELVQGRHVNSLWEREDHGKGKIAKDLSRNNLDIYHQILRAEK